MRKSVLVAGLGVLALGAVIAARTASFAPSDVADGSGITVAASPPFDVQAAAEHLGAAIRFKTVSNQEVAHNQTAEWDKLQAWLAATYPKAHGAMTKRLVGQTLLYSWSGSDPAAQPIILMAHQDVVPVTPGTEEEWKHQPFAGTIAEGAVWGRGTIDDKGSLVALFEAMEALAAQGFQPRRTIYLVSGHDEEVGGTGAAAVAKVLAAEKVRALFTIDEGGVITTDTPMIGAPAMMIGVAEKGYATIQVNAPAEGGHSSAPPKEIGSVNLAKAVLAIHASQFPVELRGPREPSPVSSTTSQGWKLIVASAHADWPGMAFSPYLVVAGTDSRNMAAVSDDVYRFMPIELVTQDIKLLHGTNEHISIRNLENQIRFFARLIATAAG